MIRDEDRCQCHWAEDGHALDNITMRCASPSVHAVTSLTGAKYRLCDYCSKDAILTGLATLD